jgi:polysaccharide export outer membrane protein
MVPVFEVVVDNNGYIALPRAGRIKAAGLTQKQAALAVNDAYKPTINNPEFDVKIMSMKVRVLGAVNKQGAYVMERENMTLADALALAEGVKYENMSKKLMIMRDGQSMEFRIRAGDLANPVLNGIIIRDNDVVYVQPSQASINAPKVAQYTAFLAPIGTIIAALTLYSTIQGLRKQ